MSKPIRILHLSDLHFTTAVNPQTRLQWLIDDLTKGNDFDFRHIDYLVVSGDVSDKGNSEGFSKAAEFVCLLLEEFKLSHQNCIFVPGNHDVQDMEEAYKHKLKIDASQASGTFIKNGDSFLVRDDQKYPERLKTFSTEFVNKVLGSSYPLEPSHQGISYFFMTDRIQFLTLNSAWEIDNFHRERASINPDALAALIRNADKQLTEADIDQREVLRIAVWHHAVTGPGMMENTEFIGHLQANHVKLCLHGDVHEMCRDLIGYWHKRMVHVVGAGSFGSPPGGRPPSTPCLYNVLEVSRDLSSIMVHTRQQRRETGVWEGWYEWPFPDNEDARVPYFKLELSPNPR